LRCLLACAALTPALAQTQALYDRFVQSVATDRSDDVAALLARGMDPNTVDPNGEPMLVVAARAGWEPTTDILLKAGAKIDAKNSFGDTAIMVASLNGHLALVKKFFARGAEINPSGWTPLAYAATNGQTEVARYLLEVGAKINAPSANGTTPLMMAVRGGHAATVDLLIAKGADVNLRNQNDATALAWATRGGFATIEQALQKRGARP
ncbi:MAG: ankyrin repeat domain-containing protein, partial [Betaproteobacteria bacterium]